MRNHKRRCWHVLSTQSKTWSKLLYEVSSNFHQWIRETKTAALLMTIKQSVTWHHLPVGSLQKTVGIFYHTFSYLISCWLFDDVDCQAYLDLMMSGCFYVLSTSLRYPWNYINFPMRDMKLDKNVPHNKRHMFSIWTPERETTCSDVHFVFSVMSAIEWVCTRSFTSIKFGSLSVIRFDFSLFLSVNSLTSECTA